MSVGDSCCGKEEEEEKVAFFPWLVRGNERQSVMNRLNADVFVTYYKGRLNDDPVATNPEDQHGCVFILGPF